MTKRYLNEKKLLAIPFDKGIGICLMKSDAYNRKLLDILELPQFEKWKPERKNAKHPILKEEEKVIKLLDELKDNEIIDEELYKKLRPIGSQPPRLYGLSKIHKPNVPLRPVLSMPGSAYHPIAEKVTEWLSVVEECQINSSTKEIVEKLKDIKLQEDEVIISFDVVSLYTNVPVQEAIDISTTLLYSGKYKEPPIDKESFKKLLTICVKDVIMLTNDGFYRQKDGLAMGSSPSPMLANAWMSQFESAIRDEAALYSRYMDDILRNIKLSQIDQKLEDINKLSPTLKFTVERESEGTIPFLDMKICHNGENLSSIWYTKPTDTGLMMNFHALAPRKYKKSTVCGMIHRIFRACSSEYNLNKSLLKARKILENNQYPASFYEPIIKSTLEKIRNPELAEVDNTEDKEEIKVQKVYVQYRGKLSEDLQSKFRRLNAPCNMIFTLKKIKHVLPSLKPTVEKSYKSGAVYEIMCPQCKLCYVGQTRRHLITRLKEHSRSEAPVGKHLTSCNTAIDINDMKVLASSKFESRLLTLEALFINDKKPGLNTRDEYKSHTLVLKI